MSLLVSDISLLREVPEALMWSTGGSRAPLKRSHLLGKEQALPTEELSSPWPQAAQAGSAHMTDQAPHFCCCHPCQRMSPTQTLSPHPAHQPDLLQWQQLRHMQGHTVWVYAKSHSSPPTFHFQKHLHILQLIGVSQQPVRRTGTGLCAHFTDKNDKAHRRKWLPKIPREPVRGES